MTNAGYKSGYVITVRQNGETIKEVDGKIPVKFHTDYQVRLRNKTRKRAVADIYIDGRLINSKGGIVINPNDYSDVERFIDESLEKGQTLRFVPLEDGRVDDKGEPANGELEVRFYPEKEYKAPETKEIHHYHNHHHWNDSHWCPWCRRWHCTCEPCWPRATWYNDAINHTPIIGGMKLGDNMTIGSSGTCGRSSSMGNFSSSLGASNISYCSAGTGTGASNHGELSDGATVKGNTSNQMFTSTYVDVDRANPIIITLKLVGFGEKARPTEVVEIVNPGLTQAQQQLIDAVKGTQYCTECGNLTTKGDKFCKNCGHKQ